MTRSTVLLVVSATLTGVLAVAFATLTGTGAPGLYAVALIGLAAGMALLGWNDRHEHPRR